MGLVFHLICLFFTLFVLQSYVSSGFHAREHRLLPLVLGLIALNSFYRITYYVTGEAQTLRILTDLLAIHMLYLMIHYVGCAALLYGNSSGAGYLCESEKRGFCLGGTCK